MKLAELKQLIKECINEEIIAEGARIRWRNLRVGDYLICIKNKFDAKLEVGKKYKIISVSEKMHRISIEIDDNHIPHGITVPSPYLTQFRLIKDYIGE
jgi:hypothetical protein